MSFEGELTGLDVLEGFVALLKADRLPLVCLIQVCGCDDRQGHVDHVLLSTTGRLVDQTAHGLPTNGVLHQQRYLFCACTHKEKPRI